MNLLFSQKSLSHEACGKLIHGTGQIYLALPPDRKLKNETLQVRQAVRTEYFLERAVRGKPTEAALQLALQREVALPESETHRGARQLLREPERLPAVFPRDLLREYRFAHTGLHVTGFQGGDEFLFRTHDAHDSTAFPQEAAEADAAEPADSCLETHLQAFQPRRCAGGDEGPARFQVRRGGVEERAGQVSGHDPARQHRALGPGDAPVARVEVPAHVGIRHRQQAYTHVPRHVTEYFQVNAWPGGIAGHERRIGSRYAHTQHPGLAHEPERRVGRQQI